MSRWMTLILIPVLTASAGCDSTLVNGNGRLREETRPLATFHSVLIQTDVPVTLQQGVPAKADLAIDGNLIAHIRTGVQNGILTVGSDKQLIPSTDARLRLFSPDVISVTHAGKAGLELKLVNAGTFTVNHKNTGGVRGTGEARLLALNVEGSGEIQMKDITAEEVAVTVTRNANVTVWAAQRAEIHHYGSGTVTVFGSPAEVDNNNRGTGRVVIHDD